ncbi:hypothetical protein POM88_044338 [Heracleum sosnowskyi]|uniref:Uncharacterized protein n=1 Tax=Heracleum sosnowskyi TaxID=360622 RepID=A0AAD8H560_9APIA|nr:hypothetical protein POM88_044338 [Heracleum sosnowskyi]
MATTAFVSSGLEFVPNNYAAPLNTANTPEAFHMIQDFLAQSAIGRALVEPAKLSGLQIKAFWESGMYDDGGETGNPSIIFEFEETEYVITAGTIRAAMGFPEFSSYTIGMGDEDLIKMMREIGYSGPLTKIGQLKRPFLRKEWSFFFDCITRTFRKKCTNWDAIPTDRVEVIDEDVSCFKLHKRIFSDLVNKDVKKGVVGDLLLPASVQQFINDQVNPPTQASPQPEPLQTELPSSTSVKPARGGRTKHMGSKPARISKSSVDIGVSTSAGTSRKKRRANRPSFADSEISHQKRRKLVADYLFEELDVSDPNAEAVQHEAPEDFVEEHVVTTADEDRVFVNAEAPEAENQEVVTDAVTKETEVNVEATVPTEDRANVDVNLEADTTTNADNFVDNLDMDFEAHPSINSDHIEEFDETEGVATDQATLVLEDSMATHIEILSVINQVLEVGDEVDQEAKSVSSEKIVGNDEKNIVIEEAVPAVEEDAEKNEAVAEKVEVTAENIVEEAAESLVQNVVVNSDLNERAQDNAEEDVPNSSNADSSANSVDTSQRVAAQHATDAHFQEMYFSNWSSRETIFSDERAADFVTKSSKEIQNPELLTHLKATIVQVKSLHNRFDTTDKVIDGLRNDIVAREVTLKKDKSLYLSLCQEQKDFSSRLLKVEENQTLMSGKIDSIAASLELLTSVLIPDDVKKGEKIPKDKCRRTPTLRLRDDSNDGGSKETEKRSKSSQEQGRLRSNSARQTNSDMINSGATGSGTHAQSSSRLKSLVISANPITDEEIAAKLFLDEHDGEVTVEDLEAEMKMLSEEHKKKVASGKGILVEEGQLPKKNYSTSDVAQVESRINKSISDVAHVDISTKVVTTSDKAQVVQTQLAPQLQGFLRPVLSETLTLEAVDFSQTRTVLGKESHDKSGLGSHREKRINNRSLDQTSLAEAGIGVSQESLDKLEYVQMVYHKGLKKEVLLYFMSDGRVYRVGEADVQLKLWEELEYVLYLLKVKIKVLTMLL